MLHNSYQVIKAFAENIGDLKFLEQEEIPTKVWRHYN